ncbi:Coronatine-insensitive protein 1 [Apostasia shenzhenica]|uniref:Coronatine-insensitive protein 1 n=1 Tax=Apostasia shenzhenica TaxID=1088818 RepID=A0A2I0B5Q7_9ASPA|nr:Coronatine-insensitive protein 1 [Apostasia shenzhenica]
MENRNHLSRVLSFGISDLALECVMGYVDDPCDRGAISLVCKKWHRIDCLTRKHVTIAICYSTTPQRLRERFPRLESLQIKGKPRAAMFFNLIPEDWGGYARPWVSEMAMDFLCLKSLHFRRMIVKDSDIDVLVHARGHILQSLKLDKCSGFSTDGLSLIAASCRNKGTSVTKLLEEGAMNEGYRMGGEERSSIKRTMRDWWRCKIAVVDYLESVSQKWKLWMKIDMSCYFTRNLQPLSASRSSGLCLRTLFLEESSIVEKDSDWLHQLAMNFSVIETLNFYMTDLAASWQDLELIAKNCRSLVSLKISDCDISNLVGFFRMATSLEEFGGGLIDGQAGEDKYKKISFPSRLCRLGFNYIGTNEMHLLLVVAPALKKLDLQYALLSTEDHCQLIQRCPNLEVLEVRDVIGDRGVEVVAQTCTKLRRLRIERGEDDQGLEDEQGMVSHRGLSAIARGCPYLEYLAVYVSDITNSALESVGTYSKNMRDFRLVLLEREERITELPLDNGVRALLRGCTKLRRFALYLRPGGLSDIGLGYVGEFSGKIRWMLLGHVGESDEGILRFARGRPKIQKLELRGCCFSELALSLAVLQFPCLRYIWVQGYNASPDGRDLMIMDRPFWNIEFFPSRKEIFDNNGIQEEMHHPSQILAYYSLAGRRTDYPPTVIPMNRQ